MARILRANLNQPRRDSGIPHESASGALGIRWRIYRERRASRGRPDPAEMLRFVSPDRDGKARAQRFFERLWQYDQVAFDASAAALSLPDRPTR
jgi:hypothetical protein